MWSVGIMIFYAVAGKYPFDGTSTYSILAKMQQLKYTFEQIKWSLQPDCKDLVNHLLQPSYKRITPEAALSHKWLNLYPIALSKGDFLGPIIANALLKYKVYPSLLKTITLNYLATQLVDKDFGPMKTAFGILNKDCDGKLNATELINGLGKYVDLDTVKQLVDEIENSPGKSITYNGLFHN